MDGPGARPRRAVFSPRNLGSYRGLIPKDIKFGCLEFRICFSNGCPNELLNAKEWAAEHDLSHEEWLNKQLVNGIVFGNVHGHVFSKNPTDNRSDWCFTVFFLIAHPSAKSDDPNISISGE